MPPAIPESTKTSLGQRLRQRQRVRWPGLAGVTVRFRGRFAYVEGELEGGEVLPLCRLRYSGSANVGCSGFQGLKLVEDLGEIDDVLALEPEPASDGARQFGDLHLVAR